MDNIQSIQTTDFQTPIEIALGVDENGMTTAKKLYAFLELEPKNYSRWCRTNIVENEFAEENVDYWAFVINEEWGGQATKDYKLTAHFAKKLSVKGNSAKAEEAREYFTRIEEKTKRQAIDRMQLSPELQRSFLLLENQAKLELEQKRIAAEQERQNKKLDTLVDTFQSNPDGDSFQKWANKCLSRIAESANFHPEYGRQSRYAFAKNESYDRLKRKWNCNLDDRVARAKGRAMERNPGITKAELNSINKLTIITNDKSLRPVYETVIKGMMIAYCVE